MNIIAPPTPLEFLTAIWGSGPHSLGWKDPSSGRSSFTNFFNTPEALIALLPELQDREVWFGAHSLRPLFEGRGSSQDVIEVVALPADLDWDHPTRRTLEPLPSEFEVRASLARMGDDLQPSIIVHSGHGLQAWWVLTTAIDPEQAEGLIAQLDTRLAEVGLANGRSDLASILRLPGTRNHKDPDDVRDVAIEVLSPRRFTPEYLHRYLPGTAIPSGTGSTRHHHGAVTDDQQALADHVIERYGGHSLDIWRDGSIHLVRPGKAARDGSSASIIVGDEGDALLTVFSDHWPDLKPGSYVLGTDGVLHHPSDATARFIINAAGPVIDVYQRLPQTFWTRPLHQAIRNAALIVGLSAEALLLTVLILVATHAPADMTLPGPRRGTINLLGALVGPPGSSKGTTLDRGIELMPPPEPHRLHMLGTAQGFVKEFHRATTNAERAAAKAANDPEPPAWVRHNEPVIIRTDEIATFAAATRKNSDNGDRLLGELKRAVSGEMLGSGYATDDKNLRCQPLTYRVVGLLGVAPIKARDLFADQGGGMPERLLFAPVIPPPDQTPPTQFSSLSPLPWNPPPPMLNAAGASFIDSPEVSEWLRATFWSQRVDPPDELEAHSTYLRHMLSASLALLDGRWTINAEDLELAEMVMEVSRATRGGLLAVLKTEGQKAGKAQTAQAAERAVTVAEAKRQHKEQVWVTKQELAIVTAVTDDPGVPVRSLRMRHGPKRPLWDQALENVKGKGLIVEQLKPMKDGGQPTRRLFLP